MSNEAEARLVIDNLLRESGWILVGEGKMLELRLKQRSLMVV